MPSIKGFEIRNFKGIKQISISLDDRTDNPVTTLIGLNESGKTTILEALSYFVSSDQLVSSLFKSQKTKSQYSQLIPINNKAAFSDTIEIEAIIELSDDDLVDIERYGQSKNLDIDTDSLSAPFKVIKKISFKDSALHENTIIWHLGLWASAPSSDVYEQVLPKEPGDIWYSLVDQIQKKLPSIAYFPTFLVDIPNRIYLKEHEGETAVNRHYRSIFKSIMEGTGDGLDIDAHICDRIDSFITSRGANWASSFSESHERSLINSVFSKISNSVTKEVIGGWRRVFSKETTAKVISFDWNIDQSNQNTPYASFVVSDGESSYEISERSLGFRWFFSFLLFTAFKGDNVKKTIWIFDEPAANLHAKAQAELLKSFERIAIDGSKVIYSTHSHHMINPRWLNGAYIVENTALNLDSDDALEFSTAPTNIKATKYKEFVSNYPTRSSYFQPIIESLEYITPELIGQSPFVLVEGISDYYALTLAQKISNINLNFRLLPGVGSGASGPIISLMMGRGEHFLILLDDDKAGLKETVRYREGWFLNDNQVFTLAKISPSFKDMALEGLLDEETLQLIEKHGDLKSSPSKKQIGWYLAESCAATTNHSALLSVNTTQQLVTVLEYLNSKTRSDF